MARQKPIRDQIAREVMERFGLNVIADPSQALVDHAEELASALVLEFAHSVLGQDVPSEKKSPSNFEWNNSLMRLELIVDAGEPALSIMRFVTLDRDESTTPHIILERDIDGHGEIAHIRVECDGRVGEPVVVALLEMATEVYEHCYRRCEVMLFDFLDYVQGLRTRSGGSAGQAIKEYYSVFRSILPKRDADQISLLVLRNKEGLLLPDPEARNQALMKLERNRARIHDSPLRHLTELLTLPISLEQSFTREALRTKSQSSTRSLKRAKYSKGNPIVPITEEILMEDTRQTVFPLVVLDDANLIVSAGFPHSRRSKVLPVLRAHQKNFEKMARHQGEMLDEFYKRFKGGGASADIGNVAEVIGRLVGGVITSVSR